MKKLKISRAVGIAVALVVGAGGLSACSTGGATSPSSGTSTKGATINVTLDNHPWSDAIKKLIPAFEKESGIKVVVTSYSETQLLDQYNVKLNAGSSEIDVMMYQPVVAGQLYANNGWLADMTKFVKSDSAWDWKDFPKSAQSTVTYDGKTFGVPVTSDSEVLYYRKDLLKDAGVEVPKTLDELASAAKKVSKENPGVSGFVARGAKSAAVSQFAGFLYSFGADWSKDGKATVDTPKAIAAYEYYGGLLKDLGPVGTTSMSWPEAMAIFTQGKAVFYPEAASLYSNATDPTKSTVADNVGFAVFPAGAAGSKPYNVPAWALGINSNSKQKQASWEFIKWTNNKANVLKLQIDGVAGARTSAWVDPNGVKGFPADLAKAMLSAQKTGVGHYFPPVIDIGTARDIIGAPIVTAIEGGDVAGAAQTANKALQQLMDKEAKK